MKLVVDPNHPLLKSRGRKPRNGSVLECETCGKHFYLTPTLFARAKTYRNSFCSRRCSFVAKINKDEPVITLEAGKCATCGRNVIKGARCVKCVVKRNRQWKLLHPERTQEIQRACTERRKVRNGGRLPRQPVPPGTYQRSEYKRYKREYFQRNRQAFIERGRKWRKLNPERAKEMARRTQRRPETKLRNRLRESERRALVRTRSDGSVTKKAIAILMEKQDGICAICKRDIRGAYQIDHMIPITRGGPHTILNIQLLCKSCNTRKYNKIVPAKRKRRPRTQHEQADLIELLEEKREQLQKLKGKAA